MMDRVFVVGLDGATWTLLQPWIDRGDLPNLGALQREGISGVLRSTLPAITSAAWSAFATGKDPSNTGIYDFYACQDKTYLVRTVTRLQVKGTSLWKRLSHHGMRSILINVPMTYPADQEINGVIITGVPTPSLNSEGSVQPSDLFERYHLDKERYMITIRLPQYEDRYADLILDLKNMIKERLKVAKTLIHEPWDFFMVHFFATDVAQHALWKFIDSDHPQYSEQNASKYGNGLREVFCEVDKAIGELLQTVDFGHTTILVLSDHGFGPNYFTVHINQWLQKIGMLKVHQPLAFVGRRISNRLTSKAGLIPQGFPAKVLRSLASFPGYLLPVSWQSFLYRNMKHFFKSDPKWSTFFDLRSYPEIFESLDWQRTRAYSVGTSGLIYINLKGREPQGAVSPGKEYEEVRNFITNELLHLADKNGRPLIDRVYRKEEIYHGKFLNDAPDLIPSSETVGCYFYPFMDREETVTEAEGFRSGNHRRDGILIAKGPCVKIKETVGPVNITDMAPTILYTLGIPLSRDMDGSVAREIFQPQFLAEHPLQHSEDSESLTLDRALSSEDERQIAKKLEDLGYL